MPVRLQSAIVSLPLHLRLLHQLPQQGAAVNDAFLGVAMVGQQEVVDSAGALAGALQAVSVTMTKGARGSRRVRRVGPDWADFDAALGSYVSCCRGDLGIRALPEHQ